MSGLIHLNSSGHINKWITGKPDFSYYLSMFKRYTDFSFELIERPFSGLKSFGSIITCDIPTDEGDLVTNITLSVELTSDLSETELLNVYTFNAGARLIEYAELIIGGQIIEKITGDYIQIHQILYNSPVSTTNTDLSILTGHNNLPSFGLYNTNVKFLIDLPFFFYRNSQLSVPICALNKHNLQLRIKLAEKKDIYMSYTEELSDPKKIENISLLVRYGFLSKPEIDFMRSTQLNYIITQLQYSNIIIKHNDENKTKRMLLNFKHPIKELYFFNKRRPEPGKVFNSKVLGDIPIKRATLKINGETLFEEDGLYLEYLQPYFNHTGLARYRVFVPKLYMYSFALDPENPEPTGQLNMSRIIHKELTIEFDITNAELWTLEDDSSLEIYGLNYNIVTFQNGLCGLKYS